jgi:hypothetical protein
MDLASLRVKWKNLWIKKPTSGHVRAVHQQEPGPHVAVRRVVRALVLAGAGVFLVRSRVVSSDCHGGSGMLKSKWFDFGMENSAKLTAVLCYLATVRRRVQSVFRGRPADCAGDKERSVAEKQEL